MTKFIPYPFYHDDVPIDISFVFENEKPAGKHGFLKVDGRDFAFEDGTKVKFWGTNFNGWGCFPEHDYAEKLAKRLAKIGLNLVRLHQLDADWHTPNIFAFTKGKRVTGAQLDPESMDRLDYLLYCLKKEGIYAYMDMYTYRTFRSDEGILGTSNRSIQAIFDDRLIELQKEHCKNLWTHVNPYTGLAYCDDPMFVLAEIVNECDLYHSRHFQLLEPYRTEFLEKFDAWLKENNIEKSAADFDLEDVENETLIDFKTYLQEKYYRTMMDCMRDCGVKIPITGTNWSSTPENTKMQLLTDYFDEHAYMYDWRWKEFEKHCANIAVTQRPDSYLAKGTKLTGIDRPTYISEWDVPWPNEYRAEGTLYSAAYGLFQGWSGFAIHTYSYTARLERMQMLGKEIFAEKIGGTPYRQGIFSTWNDPAKFGLFYHAALMTRRGDVAPAKNFTKIKPLSRSEWDEDIMKANFEKTGIVADTEIGGVASEATVDKEILSDTGELYINREKNYGWIDTDMTKCAYGFLLKNGRIDLKGMSVESETDFAVIALSSLTEDSIAHADNLLLTTVGRAQNTDAKFEGDLMLDYGKPPVLVEVIKATIEIKTDVDGLVVHAISPEGFEIGKIDTVYEDGKLKFTLGEDTQSMYYLIQKA